MRQDFVIYYCLTNEYHETGAVPAIVSVKVLDEDQLRREFHSKHSFGIGEVESHDGVVVRVEIDWGYRGPKSAYPSKYDRSGSWENVTILRTPNKPIEVKVVDFNNYSRFFHVAVELNGSLYQVRVSGADIMCLVKHSGIAKGGKVLSPVRWVLSRGHLKLVPVNETSNCVT